MQSPRKGQVHLLKHDAVGKQRPVVIVSRTELNNGIYVSAIPFGSQQLDKRQHYKSCVLISAGDGGLDRDCAALVNNLTLLRMSELTWPSIGTLEPSTMNEIDVAIKWVFDLH